MMKRKVDMRLRKLLGGLASATGVALILLATPIVTFAQETTSAIRGTVSQPDGQPAAGASVKVTDTRTGTSRTTTTSGSGNFTASNLRVGGPYTVQIEAEGFAPQEITDITLGLGDTYTFDVALSAETLETVTVTGSAIRSEQVAVGPSKTFSIEDLEDAPAINRNINDVLSIDPRIYIDEAFNDSVQCAGANPRFNALTVDGVLLSDNFGLNSNGYPTERMPFPYDAIEQVSVELAPFDVQYGGFTACNINAVTKSGGNRFSGTAFYDYTDDSLSGDELEGEPIDLGTFEEKRYGFAFGGPILEDRLFFFAAYEKLEGANIFDRGPADGNAGVPVLGVTQAQLDRIAQIARDVYGYEPGGFPSSLALEDEKYIVKLDWDINDDHRTSYTYNYNDGFNNTESDSASTEFEFANHFYERGAELKSHVLQLFSSWTDNFSTEFRYSYQDLDNRQIPLGGTDFGEVQIHTFNDPDGPTGPISPQRANIFLGADDSRHANDLYYDSTGYKLAATYQLGDHELSAGLEREELNIFNMFIQEAEGEYLFQSEAGPNILCSAANPSGCIDAFERGDPSRVTYENAAGTNIPTDAAARFGYEINTAYLQDEFPLGPVTLVAGLRYDWYTSNDVPKFNQNFFNRNGFGNQSTFDGEGLVQPRLGVTWDFSPALSFRGGVGLYSGGNPNVWMANNYQVDGITQIEFQERTLEDLTNPNTLFTIPHTGGGQPIFDIPQQLFDLVAMGTTNGGVNALDPNFKVPKEWKLALGATWNFDAGFMGEGYRVLFDYLHTRKEDSAIIRDLTLQQIDTAPDGRPVYQSIDRSNPNCLTNPPAPPGNGPTQCPSRGFTQDFLLTNVLDDDGESDVYSLALTKAYDWGFDWTFAYAYTDSTEVSPMTSSVAFSNYANISVPDPSNPGVSRSNYNIKNRFTVQMNYRKAFFGDNETKITLYGRVNEGRAFSPVFVDAGTHVIGSTTSPGFGDAVDDRHLLYIPTGPGDPNVAFASGFDQAAFFSFLESNDLMQYAGGVAPRNSLDGSWWHKFDLKISQEVPSFVEGHKFDLFFMVENLGNLINDDWGVFKEQTFPHNVQLVGMSWNTVTNQYNYNTFVTPGGQSRNSDASLWELRFGLKYSF